MEYQPYSEDREVVKADLMYRAHRHVCICEKLRQIYDVVYELPESELKLSLTELVVDAFVMGKKLAQRLSYMVNTHTDTTGNKGANLIVTPNLWETRKKRKVRR